MIVANIIVDHDDGSHQCQVSDDIFQYLTGHSQQNNCQNVYCQIQYRTYSSNNTSFIVNCTKDSTLPINHICLKDTLLGISTRNAFIINECSIEKLDQDHTAIPILEEITLLFNPTLYDKLMQLPDIRDIVEFVSKKFCIEENKTIVHSNEFLSYKWSKTIDTKPYLQGTVDFNKTRFIIVKDSIGSQFITDESLPFKSTFEIVPKNDLKVSLKCLKHKRYQDLILNNGRYSKNHLDGSLVLLADRNILIQLNLVDGSYVELSSTHNDKKVISNIFALIEPHDMDPLTVYVSPRLKMQFKDENQCILKRSTFILKDIPLARNVSLSRVNDMYQNKKLYQNIISREIKKFFIRGPRLVKRDDLIPITFDSTLTILPDSYDQLGNFNLALPSKHDSITWFKIVNINASDDNNDDVSPLEGTNTIFKDNTKYYRVDPLKDIKLVSKNIVYEKPFTLKQCDYISYYDLPPTFNYNLKCFPYAEKLFNIISSTIVCIQREIPMKVSLMLHSTRTNTGKNTLMRWISLELGINLITFDCHQVISNVSSSNSNLKILGTIKAKIDNNINMSDIPTIVYITHLEELFNRVDPNQDPITSKLSISFETEFMNIIDRFMETNKKIIFVYSSSNLENIPSRIRSKINFEIEVPVPTERQRKDIFQWYLSEDRLNFDCFKNEGLSVKFTQGEDIDLNQLAIHSAGLTPLDIKFIVQRAKVESYNEVMERECAHKILLWNNNTIPLSMEKLKESISLTREDFSVSIGAPKIPNVTWDDIGGVDMIKGEIMDTIDMPLRYPELFRSGSKQRSGILFYGPPGTGKTLMAKAIATNFSLNFFSVKGPELLNMYIGESEANVRRIFQKAREAKPCVIFFDEIDSVAPKRGNQGDSGGVMDRIVSQLLAELDGMSGNGDGVFVIGATNRPDLLDEALLRPGRFDKLLYLGIPDTNEKQYNILKALTRKFVLSEDVDLHKIAEICPFNYTGADFYALCSDSMLNAMTRTAKCVDSKVDQYNKKNNNKKLSIRQWFDKVATKDDTVVSVQMEDFIKAQSELIPSVSPEELNHYLQVKKNFEG